MMRSNRKDVSSNYFPSDGTRYPGKRITVKTAFSQIVLLNKMHQLFLLTSAVKFITECVTVFTDIGRLLLFSFCVSFVNFYSASVLRCNSHGMSVCPSVRLSVRFRCFVQTKEHTIMRFSLSGSTIILVSGEVKIIRKFAGDHPQRGR